MNSDIYRPEATNGRVSVCMATYNGERFIAAQIESILAQLPGSGEVVIVDDGSSDGTCGIIEGFRDERLRLVRHERTQGVLRSFEEAICSANGNVLFLSDQDDLWAPDKVATVLEAFQSYPDVDVIVSDAALINESGEPLRISYYAQIGGFRSGVLANIFRCRYLGCAMAFRSRIRARILPFPREADVLHDVWIGTMNSLSGGKTLYIDRPLVLYRRHEGNVTGNRRLPTTRRIRIRWDLCRSLAKNGLESYRICRT